MSKQINNLMQGKYTKPLHKFTLPDGKIYMSTYTYLFLDRSNQVVGRSNWQAMHRYKNAVIRLEMVTDFKGSTSVMSPDRFLQRVVKLNNHFPSVCL